MSKIKNNNLCLQCDGTGYIYFNDKDEVISKKEFKKLSKNNIHCTKDICDVCGGEGYVDLDNLLEVVEENNCNED